jgi:ABC-type sulfate transport system permease component
MNQVGFRLGTIFAIVAIGCLTSPPIGGAIADATQNGDYDFACVFSGFAYFISFIFIVWLRTRLVG